MGLIVPSIETPFGVTLQDAYVSVAKDMMSGTISLMETDNVYLISAYYKTYANKDSRTSGKKYMTSDAIQVSVEKDKFQNIFIHIYSALKDKFPDATDDL